MRALRRLGAYVPGLGVTVAVLLSSTACAGSRADLGAPAHRSEKTAYPTSTTSIDKSSALLPDGKTLSSSDLAAQGASDSSFFARRDHFVESLDTQGIDVTRLPRYELMASIAPQPATPKGVVLKNENAFLGTVLRLHFTAETTVADVRVDKDIMGAAHTGDVVRVTLGFMIGPNQDFTGAVIEYDAFSPILGPDQQAVFLPSAQGAGRFDASAFSEAFPISNGTVSADPASPYGKIVDRTPVQAFIDGLN